MTFGKLTQKKVFFHCIFIVVFFPVLLFQTHTKFESNPLFIYLLLYFAHYPITFVVSFIISSFIFICFALAFSIPLFLVFQVFILSPFAWFYTHPLRAPAQFQCHRYSQQVLTPQWESSFTHHHRPFY